METTMTSKGQVVVPKHAREQLRLRRGARFDVRVEDGRLVFVPIAPAPDAPSQWTPANPAGVTLGTDELCEPVTLSKE